MKRIVETILVIAGVLCVHPDRVDAQAVQELTVEEAVRLGLERNARVRAADADAAAAVAAHREVRADGLPALRTQASFTRIGGSIPGGEVSLPGFDTTFTLLPIELNRFSSEVSVEQPIFTGGRILNQSRAAEYEARAVESLATQERVDVAFQIRRTFWDLFGAVATLDAIDGAVAYIDEHVANVQNQFDQGAALMSELLTARAARSEALLDRLEAADRVRTTQLSLAQLTGFPLDTDIRPAGQPGSGLVGAATTGGAPAAGGRPDIEAMENRVRALQARLAAVRGTWLPELSLVGRYVHARPNPYAFTEQSEFRGTWEAGVVLRWSPWEGGRRSAQTVQALEQLRGAEARLQDARERADVNLARQELELRRAREAITVAAENVEQAAEAFRVTRDQFAEGIVLSARVLEAEQTYRSALAREARARAELEISLAAIAHAMGEL